MPLFHRHVPAGDQLVATPYAVETPRDTPPARPRDRSLIDLVMPKYDFRGSRTVSIDAEPAAVMRALETVTLAEMPLANAIGTLRYLPGRLLGKQRPQDDEVNQPFFEVAKPLRLGEDPGHEIVIGNVGKFHDLVDQQFVDLPDLFTFTRFNDPDYQKLVISFRAVREPGSERSLLVSEHRTLALSPASRRKFAVYWYLMVGWGGNFMLRQLLLAVKRRAERDRQQA